MKPAVSLFLAILIALFFAESALAERTSVTRVGVQDPLDSRGLGTYDVTGGSREQVGALSAFNPALSVIFDGVYENTFSGELEDPAGFGVGHGHSHGHGGDDGFRLRETEIAISGSVDSYFDAIAIFAVDDGGHIDAEEVYVVTNSLPAGLQIKAGKFLSDIGYINRQHVHDFDFAERPLVNEFLFGDHGLQETGVQISWVAPTPFYSRFGAEILQGGGSAFTNYEGSGQFEVNFLQEDGAGGFERIRARGDSGLDDSKGPRVFTVFAKVAPDLGFDHAAQFGVSGGYARTWQNAVEHSSARFESWDGDAWFAGVDAVYKYDAGRSYGHGNWTVQGEYFYREIDVDYRSRVFQDGALVPTVSGGTADEFSGKARQDGAYLQAVYGIAPRWNAGLRAEALGLTNDSLEADRGENRFESFGTSYRYSAQTSFLPTEFSRLRLQVNYADFASDHGHDEDAWTVFLQYNLSLGAHGAHEF